MNKILWRQEEVVKTQLAEFLTGKNLHPGYFYIVDTGKPLVATVVYLVLTEDKDNE